MSVERELFEMGSAFYEVVTRCQPFEGADDCAIQSSFRKGHFPDVERLPALVPVISGCWRDHYHTTEAVYRAVEDSTLLPPSDMWLLSANEGRT